MGDSEASYLTFVLNNEIFAINVAQVTEVLELRYITEVPQTPNFLKGVINLRGDIIPVINLRLKLNMNEVEDTEDTVIIILNFQLNQKMMKVGAVADKVMDVMDILLPDIKLLPDITSTYDPDFIEGMYKNKGSFLIILNIHSIVLSALPRRDLTEKIMLK
jgi:purine-binding chemotaxis protein CheW